MSKLILLGGRSSKRKKKKGGLKKPKLQKFPKSPKKNDLESLNVYAKECLFVKTENAKLLSAYNKTVEQQKAIKAKVKAMKVEIKNLRAAGKA